jgi:membrane protein
MSIMITILTAFVALEFVYIFYLETLQTTSEATSRVFNMSVETLKYTNITTLFKNQGVYNLMIAVGLVFGLIVGSREVVGFLLFNIIVVAVYGGLTSQISIIWKQGGLAIITFLLLLIL